jgi:hypothetical protein
MELAQGLSPSVAQSSFGGWTIEASRESVPSRSYAKKRAAFRSFVIRRRASAPPGPPATGRTDRFGSAFEVGQPTAQIARVARVTDRERNAVVANEHRGRDGFERSQRLGETDPNVFAVPRLRE